MPPTPPPDQAVPPPAPDLAQAGVAPAGPRPRVLCVDDDPDLLAGLQTTLRRGFEVVTADGGEAGLLRLAEGPAFLVVVSDLVMPRMDGVAFLAQAKEVAPQAERILLTGQASVPAAVAAVNLGAISTFLLKPCEPDLLCRAVGEAAARARAAEEAHATLERRVAEVFARLVEAERRVSLGTLAGAIGGELANVLMAYEAALDLVERSAGAGRPAGAEALEVLARVRQLLASHGRSLRHLATPGQDGLQASDLRQGIHAALDLLRAAGLLRHAEVELDLPDRPLLVPLQGHRLEQVFLALLRNAAQAIDDVPGRPGRVLVRARACAGAGAGQPGGGEASCSCTVEDNGCGVTKERMARLFEPPSHHGPKRKRPGLGLFVARGLVEARQGRVEVASTDGRGTCVTVTLPLVALADPVG